jgi:large conductance mechanosensitive channel
VLAEFKKFLMRGNVVDLAVAVVIGAAFGAVVAAFVTGVITPIIGLVGGHNFDNLVLTLKHAHDPTKDDVQLKYGLVISQVINFVLVAAAIFFLVIKPLNVLAERRRRGQESEEDAPPTETELLVQIRDLLAARK